MFVTDSVVLRAQRAGSPIPLITVPFTIVTLTSSREEKIETVEFLVHQTYLI